MSYYQKYRPISFKQIKGQNPIKSILINSIEKNQLHHAYIFSGKHGIGKTSIARILSLTINCQNTLSKMEPCMKCESCTSIIKGYGDLIEINGAENRGIDQIRSIKESLIYPPRFNKKVIVFDEAHMLTKEAFNALLKTIEEPPSYIIFILATTEASKLPETILSRCQHLEFKENNTSEIIDQLKEICNFENIGYEIEALKNIANFANGSMRDAVNYLEKISLSNNKDITKESVSLVLGLAGYDTVSLLFEFIKNKKVNDLIKKIDELKKNNTDFIFLFNQTIDYLLLLTSKYPTNSSLLSNFINIFIDNKNKTNLNVSPEVLYKVSCLSLIQSNLSFIEDKLSLDDEDYYMIKKILEECEIDFENNKLTIKTQNPYFKEKLKTQSKLNIINNLNIDLSIE